MRNGRKKINNEKLPGNNYWNIHYSIKKDCLNLMTRFTCVGTIFPVSPCQFPSWEHIANVWWVDLDIKCIHKFHSLTLQTFISRFLHINNWILGCILALYINAFLVKLPLVCHESSIDTVVKLLKITAAYLPNMLHSWWPGCLKCISLICRAMCKGKVSIGHFDSFLLSLFMLCIQTLIRKNNFPSGYVHQSTSE